MVLEQIDPPQGRENFGDLNTFGRFSIPWILPPQGIGVPGEGTALVDTDTLTALVDTDTLTALIQTGSATD